MHVKLAYNKSILSVKQCDIIIEVSYYSSRKHIDYYVPLSLTLDSYIRCYIVLLDAKLLYLLLLML